MNILGTEYTIVHDTNQLTENIKGTCNFKKKTINVAPDVNSGILRHELIHAFLYESGMVTYGEDEHLVDWIAWMYPVFTKIFKDLKIES